MDTSGIDMNNPTNLAYYSQILLFKNDIFRNELLFPSSDTIQRRALHTLADDFGLEYEYSRITKEVRITRSEDATVDIPWLNDPLIPSAVKRNDCVTDSQVSSDLGGESISIDPSHAPPSFEEDLVDESALELHHPGPVDREITSLNFGSGPLDVSLDSISGNSRSVFDSFATSSEEAPTSLGSTAQENANEDVNYNIPRNTEDDEPPRGRSRHSTRSPTLPSFPPSWHFDFTLPTTPTWPSTFGVASGPGRIGSTFLNGTPMTSRKALTDDDRRRMCQYHEDNPTVKQTEIGAMFGVERSTVSKVLRQKDKYLCRDQQTPNRIPRQKTQLFSVEQKTYERSESEVASPGSSEIHSPSFGSPLSRPYSASSSPSRRLSSPMGGLSPSRDGPLDHKVQSNMRAVKASGGACWRCRILRKSCNSQTPCVTCPSGDSRSNWGLVGCRRGTLKSQMPSLDISVDMGLLGSRLSAKDFSEASSKELDQTSEDNIDQYEQYLRTGKLDPHSETFKLLENLESTHPIIEGLKDAESSEFTLDDAAFLDKCILDIILSIQLAPISKSLFPPEDLKELAVLARFAARYYVEGRRARAHGAFDKLIYESLKCLRTAVDILRETSLYASEEVRRDLKYPKAHLTWQFQQDRFLDELSRALFLKENMTQKSLWLSIFYSFCIHSRVRKILMHLSAWALIKRQLVSPLRFDQYLYLGVRLFTAASGGYDLLHEDFEATPILSLIDFSVKHSDAARLAVQQSQWKERAISGSYDYLRQLFEDTGCNLEINPDAEPPTAQAPQDRTLINNSPYSITGIFSCEYPGCTAPPFQTQYLLNSHANVHSSDRPYYCPVAGCPRSEGGKGFKRKSEMIRHRRGHDYTGYICPFYSEERKYPRPDNLARHVRNFHPDKDKNDPQLKEVLSQRSVILNRGRKRRAELPPGLPEGSLTESLSSPGLPALSLSLTDLSDSKPKSPT